MSRLVCTSIKAGTDRKKFFGPYQSLPHFSQKMSIGVWGFLEIDFASEQEPDVGLMQESQAELLPLSIRKSFRPAQKRAASKISPTSIFWSIKLNQTIRVTRKAIIQATAVE